MVAAFGLVRALDLVNLSEKPSRKPAATFLFHPLNAKMRRRELISAGSFK